MWRGRQLEHFEWVTDFLEARNALSLTRLFVAATATAMSVALLVLLFGSGGPRTQPAQTMMWLAVGGGVAGTLLWLWRWPSRRQSAAFAAITTASIALACLAYPDPLAALLGCIAFTTIAGYVAFFHAAPVIRGTLVVVVAVAATRAVELAGEGRAALAIVDLFLVLQANIAITLAIHGLLRTVKGDLTVANLDPLTGLLNRRAFRRQVSAEVAQRHDAAGDGYLLVGLIDLDGFKSLNDSLGHAAGDRALIAVADALRASAASTAVVARIGGEEFLIADLVSSHRDVLICQHICTAIDELPIPTTASVGTACMKLDALARGDFDEAMDSLISAADMAMYRAKRNGGNQCNHHGTLL
ncbi:GGDEF domain-containing protein [Mycobacterium sp. MS1601]|nr:GGDEF domain-containing protein [Mycobacterium sp. MS1601]